MPLKDGENDYEQENRNCYYYPGIIFNNRRIGSTKRNNSFDDAIQSFVFSMHRYFLTGFFKIVTYSANWQTIVIFCAVFLTIKRTRIRIGVPLSFASAISTTLYKLVKMAYARPRPDIGFHLIEQGGLSFPSGHSMTGLVFYGLLIYFITEYGKENRAQKALISLLVVLIVLIGFSRVYLGVHYPTDVLAGWFLGISILVSAIILLEKGYTERIKFGKFKLK